MPALIRKLAALLLLLVIPLQGVAAFSVSAMECPPAVAGAAHPSNGDDGTDQKSDGDAVKTFFEHFFCHQLSSVIPGIPATGAPPDLPVFEPSISLLSSLFFPEQPQRPPLSASA
ncbi:MAG: hypothetical protein HY526_03960 [Betaproteobacteria bacterium]|nr:hypothetical protein [Betaproteobacteria bacterium]